MRKLVCCLTQLQICLYHIMLTTVKTIFCRIQCSVVEKVLYSILLKPCDACSCKNAFFEKVFINFNYELMHGTRIPNEN